MTTIYFVRHAEPNLNNHDDMTRELSERGVQDRKLVTAFLLDKEVDVILSSPFKRAVDTVCDFAELKEMEIHIVDDFRERRIDSGWIEDFASFCKAQWADFDYKLADGECLREVQERNISALSQVLKEYEGKTIVVGSHGTALSTIINYYDQLFGFEEFNEIKKLMPWIVKFTFEGLECKNIEPYNVFEMELWDAYRADGSLAGFDMIRGVKVPEGYYHMVCEAVIQHRDGDYLLMQRDFCKEIFPGKWEIGAGGSALKGETEQEAVKREIAEETGVTDGEWKKIYHIVHEKNRSIYCGYLLITDMDKHKVRLQQGETIDYKWVSKEELFTFYESEECTPSSKERLVDFMKSIR